MSHKLSLRLWRGRYAVCRVPPRAPVPPWAAGAGEFTSVTRTREETSVVCAEDAVPPGIPCAAGWRILEVAGPLDFEQTGILASVASPLAHAGVSIFTVSTYGTDYVLIGEPQLDTALQPLRAAGHTVEQSTG